MKAKNTPPTPNDFTGNVEMTWEGADGSKALGTQAESTWLQDGKVSLPRENFTYADPRLCNSTVGFPEAPWMDLQAIRISDM